MKILVLGGGDSPEREVSQRSAKAIADGARSAGFEVKEADPRDGLEILDEISKDTIVMPILHGKNGEDGKLQAELEKRGLAYLGSDSQSSRNCLNKWLARKILAKNNIPIPEGVRVNRSSYKSERLTKKPHVLKTLHGGSNLGTLIVRRPEKTTQKQLDETFGVENDAVLESLVEGIEITVPILDHSALPPIEIYPPDGVEFDYENKCNGRSAELCPPPSLDEKHIKKVQSLAEEVHGVMNCRHLSRVDTIMKPNGSFVVLEINTIPGLTNQSLYPKSAKVAGMGMPALVAKFVELVKRDYNL